jgi:GNAT superfamily N-acetyltransferase
MALTLHEVHSKRSLKKFITYPLKLYKNNPFFVPNLVTDDMNTMHWGRNPAFDHCEARYWIAYRDGRIVGRIAGIINHRHIEKWKEPYIRFNWLDFIDDDSVSSLLLGTVENWAREEGLTAVHGPLGFTDMDREGMLVEGFNEIATMATHYNYPYYPEHLDRLGYVKDIDWIEYQLTVPEQLDERIERAARIVLKRNNLHMLQVHHKRELLVYAHQLFHLLNQEYSHLYGATPISEREIDRYVRAYFGFVHPDFVPVILNEKDQMVAFGITIPSLSRALQKSRGRLFPLGWLHLLRALRNNSVADLYLIAVSKKFQGLGVNMVLMDHICHVFNRRGITKVETNPELETNINVQSQWKTIEKRQHKRRRCFIKKLPAK